MRQTTGNRPGDRVSDGIPKSPFVLVAFSLPGHVAEPDPNFLADADAFDRRITKPWTDSDRGRISSLHTSLRQAGEHGLWRAAVHWRVC